MRAFGVLDQVYPILGKACLGSIDSEVSIVNGVDCNSSGDVLTGQASIAKAKLCPI